MAMDFPSSPSVNDTHSPAGSPYTYQWDGTVWIIAGGTTTALPDEAPENGLTYGRKDAGWQQAPQTAQEGGVGVLVNNIIKVTQAEYDALSSPDANTLYLIGS